MTGTFEIKKPVSSAVFALLNQMIEKGITKKEMLDELREIGSLELATAYAEELLITMVESGYDTGNITSSELAEAILDGGFSNNTDNSAATVSVPSASKITSVENKSTGTKVTWKAVNGATSYILYRKTGTGKWTKVKSLAATTYTDTKAKTNGTKYQYKVYASNSVGTGKASSTITTYYLSGVKLSKATNVKGKKVSAQWKKNTKASGYQVKYATGKKTVTKSYKKASTLKATISRLTKNKTYKFYVRAYKTVSKKNYYSPWSSAKTVKIKK